MFKSILIIIAFFLTISTSFGQNKAKLIKVTDLISDQSLQLMADSTGMIDVPNLVAKLKSYSPNTYYINTQKREATSNIIKQAKDHMIPGDTYVFVTDYAKNASISKHEDGHGNIYFTSTRTDNSTLKIDIPLAKKFRFVFAQK